MTIPYDSTFDPPALVLTVTVTGVVRTRPRLQLNALIDTGADMTAIPRTAIRRLNLYEVGRMTVEDIHARLVKVDIYSAQLTLAGQPTRKMEVVETDLPFIVLGRDWLQDYYLYLQGPDKIFEISSTPLT